MDDFIPFCEAEQACSWVMHTRGVLARDVLLQICRVQALCVKLDSTLCQL